MSKRKLSNHRIDWLLLLYIYRYICWKKNKGVESKKNSNNQHEYENIADIPRRPINYVNMHSMHITAV